MEVLYLIKKYKYHLFIAINLLWVWALLSPNIYYFDDSYRASGGFYNWGGDFRPFADWLYYILGVGQRFSDLTPFPQILALIFLYFTYYLFVSDFSDNEIKFPILLVFIPIVWNPFLLSNLYFRYDSIFMILAILLSVLSIEFVNNRKYIIAILFLFISCGLYQPAIVAYVCAALFLIYRINGNSVRDSFFIWVHKSIIYFFIFFVTIFVYYFTIMKYTVFHNNYSSTHSQISIFNFYPNLIKVVDNIKVIYMGDTGYLYFFINLYLMFFNLFFLLRKYSYYGVVVFFVANFIFIMMAAGVNLFLDVPRFEYRTFIFYGFYISFLLYSFYCYFKHTKYELLLCMVLFFISYYYFSISLNLSNAQKIQSVYEDFLTYDIAKSIHNNKLNKNKTFVFVGESSPSNVLVLSDKYPIIKKSVIHPVHFSFKIKKYYPHEFNSFTFNNLSDENDFLKSNVKKIRLLEDNIFYNLYDMPVENKVVIYLKNGGF